MDGLYQDIIIMLTIFFVGMWGMYHYYQLKSNFEELQADFHRCDFLTKGKIYSEDTLKMQDDIISLKQSCVNLNVKINKNEQWSVKSIGEITQIVSDVTNQLPTVETMNTMAALGRISVQDVIDIKND